MHAVDMHAETGDLYARGQDVRWRPVTTGGCARPVLTLETGDLNVRWSGGCPRPVLTLETGDLDVWWSGRCLRADCVLLNVIETKDGALESVSDNINAAVSVSVIVVGR